MEWADLSTACTVLLAVATAVLTLDKVNDLVNKRHTEPMLSERDFRERTVSRLEQGERRMERQDEAIGLLLRGQLQVMNHMAYGNHTDELKRTIDEYQDFLIKERDQ